MFSSSALPSLQALVASLSPLDWLLALVALWSIVRGFLHGAIRELFALLAAVVALFTAYWQYRPTAIWLRRWIDSAGERDVVAFLAVALLAFVAVVLVGRIVRAVVHLAGLGLLDRLAGAVLGLTRALVVGTVIITALTAFVTGRTFVRDSRLVPYLVPATKFLAQAAPWELKQRIWAGISVWPRWGTLFRNTRNLAGSNPDDEGQ